MHTVGRLIGYVNEPNFTPLPSPHFNFKLGINEMLLRMRTIIPVAISSYFLFCLKITVKQ